MFSSQMGGLTGNKRQRSWSVGSGAKLASKRLISQLMCRLPLLTLWTLIVIFMLYKSLINTDYKSSEEASELQATITNSYDPTRGTTSSDTNQVSIHHTQSNSKYHPNPQELTSTRTFDSSGHGANTRQHHQRSTVVSTSPKTSASEHSRQGKVFILIIQDEDLHPYNPSHKFHQSTHLSAPISNPSLPKTRNHRLVIPAHIRVLISVLESHRIDYVIDSTRAGLPTALLTDQDNSSENKQYSVMVIDDFIKYTKLSRWVRDQLDRHCRTNHIGVITYLATDYDLGSKHQKTDANRRSRRSGRRIVSRSNNDLSSEESLADQFPLTFKPIEQRSCHSSFETCLFDYQLNEKSPILRILKRRKNFILKGPLVANLNQMPWISMGSDHITYEPLTWARLGEINTTQSPTSASNQMHLAPSNVVNVAHQMNLSDSVSKSGESELGLSSVEYADESGQGLGDDQGFVPSNQSQTFLVADYSGSLNSSSYDTSPLASASEVDNANDRQVLSMFDKGLYDGIKRVIFGGANHHWLNRVLLLDAIEHLSDGRILDPLDRYIQIDIDDIFVGETGKRMNGSDVKSLIETQRKLAQRIENGFKFNLGFSGKYFKHGHKSENLGDEQLVINAQEFTWFCHFWSHSKAHLLNDSRSIADELLKNLAFAREHDLPIIGQNGHLYEVGVPDDEGGIKERRNMLPTYAIAPHHSGVYPIHEQLYEAWRAILNVQVTSTEEYPRLRPASGRRAFVHKIIKVLPRQTCGLYTHTIHRNKYPGGIGKLDAMIEGGELFETILHNPVNIYMTHMSNYANDRLAPYTFTALLDFVQANTNLRLKYAPTLPGQQLGPSKLADYYFSLYPNEREPLWTNPCSERRHLAIWAPHKHTYCRYSVAPKLLIVGPQKTGTTALYFFLKASPIFHSSQVSPIDFEEVQFFNDKHYHEGVDWYLSKFMPEGATRAQQTDSSDGSEANSETQVFAFDKSATYFDDPKVPLRAHTLLPEAYIIILLLNPADRAYSWYQHMKAHGDPAANLMSFEQVIMWRGDGTSAAAAASETDPLEATNAAANDTHLLLSAQRVRALRNRCLNPGYYSQHLNRWLEHYPSRQIIIIDGQWFRHNPASVMNRLQLLLRVSQPIDYTKLLVFNEKKGFYCLRDSPDGAAVSEGATINEIRCLGRSKGRKYAPMSPTARLYLNRHYWAHNRQLARILSEIGQPLPTWLDEAMASQLGQVRSVVYQS